MPKLLTKARLREIQNARRSSQAIIFLSGPSAVEAPLSRLAERDILAVNGSAGYLVDHGIRPFIYLVTDIRFIEAREADFRRFVASSQFCIINQDVYHKASESNKLWLEQHCYIIQELYKREKAGPLKKLRFAIYTLRHRDVVMHVPLSRKKRILGFSKDITLGYCNCKTVAYVCMQLAYSLEYQKIICAGLDMNGSFGRFYDNSSSPALNTELREDLKKILPLFTYMRTEVDPPVFTLSKSTSVPYSDIPLITLEELENDKI